MLYLDTHVVLWLAEGYFDEFNQKIFHLLEQNNLLISPIVKLELQYLYEIKRTTRTAEKIIYTLHTEIGLSVCSVSFEEIVNQAIELKWTRDPFDRLIVANALCKNLPLLTKDRIIRKHTKIACWG